MPIQNATEAQGSGNSVTNNILSDILDISSSAYISVQLYGTFVAALVPEVSNDGQTWVAIQLVSVAGGSGLTSFGATGMYVGGISAKYFRLRVLSYTSGTINVSVALFNTDRGTDDRINTITTVSTLTTLAGGSIAHDAVDSGNPHKIGGKARNADPTPVANLDRAELYVDLLGKPVVVPIVPRALIAQTAGVLILNSTTETTLLAAGGASYFLDISNIIISNTSATAVRVDFRDVTVGAVRISVNIPAGETKVIDFNDLPLLQTTANNVWTAQLSAAVTDVRITATAAKRQA